MNFAVSSIAFLGKPVEEIVDSCTKNSWALEFSSGMPFRSDMEKIFLDTKIKKYAHNYFPAPEIPFVLNLASTNETLRLLSVSHCLKGLELSSKAKAPFFSAHAGFCIDPNPEELGNQLNKNHELNKEKNWKVFKESLHVILKKASELNMKFLIENNVIAKMNLYENGINPLFCCEENEIKQLFREMKNPSLGLLLDTAHWKVSGNTLGFDFKKSINNIRHFIDCIHHSDNEGEFDNNLSIDAKYWFLPEMRSFKNTLHVLEVKKIKESEIEIQMNLLKHSMN